MLADIGMLSPKYVLASMVASSFLSQNALLPYGEGLAEMTAIPRKLSQSHRVKMHGLAQRTAALLGPWIGVLIGDFESCVWWSLILTMAASCLPFLLESCGSGGTDAQWALAYDSHIPPVFADVAAKSAVAFVLLWRFFSAFGFYAFNMLLTSSLSHAGPWLLASVGSTCGIGELVAIKVSFLLDARQSDSGKFIWQSASSVASVALKVVALGRLSAFFLVSSTGGAASTTVAPSSSFSLGDIINTLDIGVLLFSLLVSILAATLLSDVQSQVVSRIVQIEGGTHIPHLERAADALAGVTGPLYIRSVVAQHGSGVAMAGIFSLYIMMHLFVHVGLSRIIAPFLTGMCARHGSGHTVEPNAHEREQRDRPTARHHGPSD